jgi:hypothetical protein
MTVWAMMELIKDPELYSAVREEVQDAYVADPVSGRRTIDVQKLLALPLLQSVFVEILRLHMSVNLTREVLNDTSLGGCKIPKGSYIMAPTPVSHHDERSWGREGHPASEFWGYRHLTHNTHVDESGKLVSKPEFSMAGKTGVYFPFGRLHSRPDRNPIHRLTNRTH